MESYSHILNYLNQSVQVFSSDTAQLKPKELYEPMTYILSLGGKRIRPLMCLIACDLFDQPIEKAHQAALAVELFHNFSLIHDDILDNAPLRRGQDTVHEKWNTNVAILSGDGMLVKAFECIQFAEPDKVRELLTLFTKTSLEVCEGQQMDMNFETLDGVSVEEYIHMITGKTAVLLGCSLQMGAICAGADVESQNHLYEFGKHVGIAFQLLDDMLDVYAKDASKFGKQIGGDIISNKKTFLLLKAFELSDEQMKGELKLWMEDSSSSRKVDAITKIFDQLGIKDLVLAEADLHTQHALEHLEQLKVNTHKKEQLKSLAMQLLNREV